jgi:O-antigen/teichoic acid export membrane protein
MISDTLGRVAARGAAFLTMLTVAGTIINSCRNIVLARLLSPEDFGLIALALVLIEGMDALTSVGVDKYLIQKKEIDDTVIGNIWLLNIIRGIALTLLALAICPLYSRLVNEPETIHILRIVAFIPLLEGLNNPCTILAEREMKFGRVSIYETLCIILEVGMVIIMAWLIRDANALAWGLLFGAFTTSLLSYFFFRRPNIPKFDLSSQLELLGVAKHFVIIAAGTLIMVQGDNLIVGALKGKEQLGLYVIAYQFAVFPLQFLYGITNRIALPMFSSLQINKERLRSVFSYVVQIQLATIIPFVVVAGVFAHELITTLYGDQWTASAVVLQALIFVTLGKGLTHACVPYILGTGAFSFASKMKIAETLIFLCCVYLGTRYFGLIGAALGAGAGYMSAGIGRLIFICRDTKLPFSDILKYLLLSTITVIPGVVIARYVADTVTWHSIAETIAILGIVGVSSVGCSLILQKNLWDILIQKVLRSE